MTQSAAISVDTNLRRCRGAFVRLFIGQLFLTFVFIALGPVSVHSHGRIDFETVAAIARKSAAEASRAPQRIRELVRPVPRYSIRRGEITVARSRQLSSAVYPPRLVLRSPVKVNIIDSSAVRAAAYSPQLFSFGTNKFGDRNCRRSRLCGFRRSIPDFRAAKNFRRSKNFWLQRPRPDAHEMTLMGARVRHTKSDRECSRFPVASYRRCGERTEGRSRAYRD
jgi:glucan biosynthesis protein